MNVDKIMAANSKYVSGAELKGKPPIQLTIRSIEWESVGQGDEAEEKFVAYFNGAKKGMVLNNINLMTIKDDLGPETDGWVGQMLEVYFDPNVSFGKKRTGGVRCRVVFAQNSPTPAQVRRPIAPAPPAQAPVFPQYQGDIPPAPPPRQAGDPGPQSAADYGADPFGAALNDEIPF